MKFYTQYDVPDKFEEKNSGEIIVESAGYVPSKVMIENMMFAGRALDEARMNSGYDSDEEAIDNYDPTTEPDYDIVDAHQDGLAVDQRLREQKEAAERSAKEAAEKAEKEEKKNSTDVE